MRVSTLNFCQYSLLEFESEHPGGVLVEIDQSWIIPSRCVSVGLRFMLLELSAMLSLSKLLSKLLSRPSRLVTDAGDTDLSAKLRWNPRLDGQEL
eukprot:4372706-Amphidinium_carterae.1